MINCRHSIDDPVYAEVWEMTSRMSSMDGWSEKYAFEVSARRDLCIALLNCDSTDEVFQCIEDFVLNETKCPTVADVRRKIHEAHDARDGGLAGRLLSQWKREDERKRGKNPLAGLSGIFKRERDPEADQHMDLLTARIDARRGSDEWYALTAQIHAIERGWGLRRCYPGCTCERPARSTAA